MKGIKSFLLSIVHWSRWSQQIASTFIYNHVLRGEEVIHQIAMSSNNFESVHIGRIVKLYKVVWGILNPIRQFNGKEKFTKLLSSLLN